VQEIADENGSSFVEVFRRFIKLGLIATEVEKSPDSMLIIRTGDTERQLVLL